MKHVFLFLLFLLAQFSCLAQTAIVYIYDDSGNRITRIPSTEETYVYRHYQTTQAATIAIRNECLLYNNRNVFCKSIKSYYAGTLNLYFTKLYEWNNISDYSNERFSTPKITACNFNTKQKRI